LIRETPLGVSSRLVAAAASGPSGAQRLEQAFRTPPADAKPRVWWHWMNGNITKEGIKLDLEWMRRVGGFELAALTGAYLACAQQGIVALVDGFICSVAALCAVRLNPACRDWLLFAHRSAEPGHLAILDALDAQPLLDLGLRLGEGSGAALAVPLLRLACELHNGMATFAEAAVSGQRA